MKSHFRTIIRNDSAHQVMVVTVTSADSGLSHPLILHNLECLREGLVRQYE